MVRSVKEWIGKTDDTPPSTACKLRIVARQDGCCALSGRPFTAKEKPQFDHKVPLWLGGQNRESNLHAIHKPEHQAKTTAEAKVRAKASAQAAANLGLKPKTKRPIPSPPKAPKPAPKPALAPRPMFKQIGDSHV